MITESDAQDKPRLLIVDDDPMTCRLIKIQLETEGYVCATLSDPERTLEAVAEESPELVLMDFHLGTQEGLDLLQIIRNHQEYDRLPVVVMSAVDYRRESDLAGADGFVLKPFNLKELTAVISQVLEQRKE